MDRLAGRLVERLREDPDEPAVVGLDGKEADRLFDALGSETSRAVLSACYESGRTRSELADVLDTSLQNVGYHVDKLESAGLLEAVETRYGKNGREVCVYEPSKRAVVIAAGEPGLTSRLSAALDRLLAPILLVGLVALAAGVLARGPERFGMLGADAAPATPEPNHWLVTSAVVFVFVFVFVFGLLVVLLADRFGAFESDSHRTTSRRSGRSGLLLGQSPPSTRRHAFAAGVLCLSTILSLDVALVTASRGIGSVGTIAVALTIPAGALGAAVSAFRNDGVVLSFLLASAPFAGGWCYLVAGDAFRYGLEPAHAIAGAVVLLGVGVPLGSLAYLAGRLPHRFASGSAGPGRRVTLALLGYPAAVTLVALGLLLRAGPF